MSDKLRKKDFIWAYAGYIADISVYAILTPFLTVMLDSFELGLWYTFMGIYSLINLLDSGFSPIFVRNSSYCMAGAEEFLKEGVPKMEKEGKPNYVLLSVLFKANRFLLLLLAVCIYIIALMVGTPYIIYVTRSAFNIQYIAAWLIFMAGVTLNVYFIGIPSFLKGMGYIAEGQKIIAISRCSQLIFCLIGVVTGFGIMGLSVGVLGGGLISGSLSLFYYFRYCKPKFIKNCSLRTWEIIKIIWHNSYKLFLVAMGGYLINQANTILCSTFLGLEVTASYGLSIQAVQAIGIISFVYMQVVIPEISKAKVNADVNKQKTLLGTASCVFLVLDVLGNAAVILFVNNILVFIGAKTLILSTPLMILIAITNLLDKHSNIYSQFIVCDNRVPFVKASIFSGVIIVIVSFVLLKTTVWGVFGFVSTQMIVQLAYNNWKWPYVVCKELDTNLTSINKTGIINIKKFLQK